MAIHQDAMPTWERMVTAIPRGAIRGLDTLLRRAYGVYEFTDAEWCLLRVATIRSPMDSTLSDGIKVAKGERIGELHLWNEHIPTMPRVGPDFRWGIRAYVLLLRSLRALVQYTLTDPELGRLRAWHGKSSFLPKAMGSTDALTKLGFDVVRPESSPNHLRRFVDAVDNSYWWVLAWTFNPASLNAKEWLRLERWEIWISAAKLRKKYGRRNQQNTAG